MIQEELLDLGIDISAGQIDRLLNEGHEQFHQEKDALLPAAREVSSYFQADDTGARHLGKNAYTTVIANPWFASFSTTPSKIPLHNNLSERDIREWAKKRKISAGTRSELGRRCRDTFISLKKTCRKLGVSFWRYLQDRIRGAGEILPLPELIRQAAQET